MLQERYPRLLLPMVQTFFIVLHSWNALCGALGVLFGRVDDVASQEFLPKGEAAGWA